MYYYRLQASRKMEKQQITQNVSQYTCPLSMLFYALKLIYFADQLKKKKPKKKFKIKSVGSGEIHHFNVRSIIDARQTRRNMIDIRRIVISILSWFFLFRLFFVTCIPCLRTWSIIVITGLFFSPQIQSQQNTNVFFVFHMKRIPQMHSFYSVFW